MLVMTHHEIAHVLCVGKVFTYVNLVVNHRPPKEDPNCIQITAGGNLLIMRKNCQSEQQT